LAGKAFFRPMVECDYETPSFSYKLWALAEMRIRLARLIETVRPLAEPRAVVTGSEHRVVVGPGISLLKNKGVAVNHAVLVKTITK
jgi:hypothetical protein